MVNNHKKYNKNYKTDNIKKDNKMIAQKIITKIIRKLNKYYDFYKNKKNYNI